MFFVNAQNLMEEQVLSKPSKSLVVIQKSNTTSYISNPIVYATKCAQNTTFGKPEFYTYLNNSMKKVLSTGLSEMGVDTLNCEIISSDSIFHILNKDEYSAFYIKTILKNGEYAQNSRVQMEPYCRGQKVPLTEKKPKVFIDYFYDEVNSEYMNLRIFVKR